MTAPSLLILGTDAVLAAVPATPVQLAHACLASGFNAVIPASWGEELIAARALDRLRAGHTPVVQCCCPHVSRRMAAHGNAIASMLATFVPPPVATAQYLRAIFAPAQPRITYAGGCPSGVDSRIDVWLSVDELMGTLADRGIATLAQPTEFDSVIPPDRRRYYSDPGGVPSRNALRNLAPPAQLVELMADDLMLNVAQHLLSGARILIDVAVPLGCCCSGALGGVTAEVARARVREHEPPRALSPVVDHTLELQLHEPIAPPLEHPPPRRGSEPLAPVTPESELVAVEAPRRRSPPGLPRPVLGAMPVRRSEGRQLPRAYVARRRSSPRGVRRSGVFGDDWKTAGAPERTTWMWIAGGGLLLLAGLALLLQVLL